MNQTEKDNLVKMLEAEITDWNTSWNNGRNEGINEAIKIIKASPVESEGIQPAINMQRHCTDCKLCKQIDTIRSGKYTNFIYKCTLPKSTYVFSDNWRKTEALTCDKYTEHEPEKAINL